jgi:hypothetical protein
MACGIFFLGGNGRPDVQMFAMFLVAQLVRTSDIPVSADAAVSSHQGKQPPLHSDSLQNILDRRHDSNPGQRRSDWIRARNEIGFSLRGGGPEGKRDTTFAPQSDSKRASTDAMKL